MLARMDLYREDPGRAGRLLAWLQATPAELAGLTVLLAGALLVTGLLWWQAGQRPQPPDTAAPAGYLDGSPSNAYDEGLGDPSAHAGHPAGNAGDRAATGPLTVHVTGAVAEPGLVTVPAGGRVGDAVTAAGGLTAEADPASVNLARLLEDGEHVHVAAEGEAAGPPATAEAAPGGAGGTGRVDINRATSEQLQTLPGIGPALAERILQHRQTHGPFRTPGDLRAVSGIGEKTFQRLADLITVS